MYQIINIPGVIVAIPSTKVVTKVKTKRTTPLQKIKNKLASLGFTVEITGTNFYNSCTYRIYTSKAVKREHLYDYATAYTYINKLWMQSGSASFSCGVPELGNFTKELTLQHTDEVVLLFMKLIQVHEKSPYLRIITTSQKVYDRWNYLLPQAGFTKRVTLSSKHGRGKYKVIVWEWFKEMQT